MKPNNTIILELVEANCDFYRTHPDNLQSQLVVVGVAPLVEAEPLGLGPVHPLAAQVPLRQGHPQLQQKLG